MIELAEQPRNESQIARMSSEALEELGISQRQAVAFDRIIERQLQAVRDEREWLEKMHEEGM